MAAPVLYVGMFYDGAWQDITTDVRQAGGIELERGKSRPDGPSASSITLTLANKTDKYNPRNAMSPLYGKVGQKTPLTVGYDPVDEDFEDTTYNIGWSTYGDANWARTNTLAHTGTWSMKSGTITGGQQSNLVLNVPAGTNTLIFWARTDTEKNFDLLGVFTDEGLQWQGSGQTEWTQVAVDVSGSATVIFNYAKDSSINVGADAVWIDDVRFLDARGTGEIKTFKPDRTLGHRPLTPDPNRHNATMTITAYGLTNRIACATDPIRSALYRATMRATTPPTEFWPLEDADGSVAAVSALGGNPMRPVTTVRYTLPDGTALPPGGAPKFAADNGVPGTDKLVTLTSGGTLRGYPPAIAAGGYAIDFVFRCNPGAADGTTSTDIAAWYETGTYRHFRVNLTKNALTVFHANAADDATLASTGSAVASFAVYDGTAHHVRYTVAQNGGSYLARLYIDGNLKATADNFTPGMTGTVGRPNLIDLNPIEDRGDYMPAAIGGVTVWATATPPDTVAAAFGTPGERCAARLKRFGIEEGWKVNIRSGYDATMPMGPQSTAALPNQLAEIERTEDGLVVDQRGAIGLQLRTRTSQYNQSPRLQLSYIDGTIQMIEQKLDDVATANDVTVRNYDGTEARAVLASGPLSVDPNPPGVGRLPAGVDVNMQVNGTGPALADVAEWWLGKGTVNRARYPQITVDVWASPQLRAAASAVDAGDRITLQNLEWDLIDLRVIGVQESKQGPRQHITFLCEPYQPFLTGVYDGTARRRDSKSTTLNAGVTSTANTLVFNTTDPGDLWRPGGGGYDVVIAGEQITVPAGGMGAVTGTGPYLQTATGCTRSVNGVVKVLAAGEPIHVRNPARYAL
jgi:hypothetical protein